MALATAAGCASTATLPDGGGFQPSANAMAATQHLYALNGQYGPSLSVFTLGGKQAVPSYAIKLPYTAGSFAVDANRNVYVAGQVAAGSNQFQQYIFVYNAGKTKPAYHIKTCDIGGELAFPVFHGGDLYASQGGTATCPAAIDVFSPGAKTPSRRITSGLHLPEYLAFDWSGNLYVLDNVPSHGLSIVEFKAGGSSPSRTISNVGGTGNFTLDRSGGVWVSYNDLNPSAPASKILYYAPAATKPSKTITRGLYSAGGLIVDAANAVYIDNQQKNNAHELLKYAAGASAPSQTITNGIGSISGGNGALAFDARANLYVANYFAGGFGGPGSIAVYAPNAMTASYQIQGVGNPGSILIGP